MSMGISRLFDRRISIRTYLAATIFFTTIPIAAFLIFYIKGLWDDGVHHAHDKAYVEAEKMSAAIYRQIGDRRDILAQLATRPEIVEPSSRQCSETLKLYQQTFPDMAAVTIRSVSGEPLCSSWPSVARQTISPSQTRWFSEAIKANDFYVTNAVVGPTSRRWVIGLTYPIRDSSGHPKSILIFAVDLLKLNQRLLSGPYGHTIISVIDRSSNVILRSRQPESAIGRPLPKRVADIHRSQGDGTFRTLDNCKDESIGAYVRVPLTDWVVSESYPENEVLAPTVTKIKTAMFLGLLIVIALFAIVFGIYRAIVVYCRALADTAEQIRLGNLSARAPSDGPRELALVALQFNLMVDAVQRRQVEILQVNSAVAEILEAMRTPPA